ncbi:hypothetical protein HUB98_07110 [Paenibacillus barcinonensis]|uniref:CDI immunity protein domain-containing protein n=2 Tax=Paenibacillus barcinonensis TaxID=198119 RepID=A0ABX6QCT0_PAEBA|nr:hypothetical protein HUB98_07110 [Paenibacillus barcinonensis]
MSGILFLDYGFSKSFNILRRSRKIWVWFRSTEVQFSSYHSPEEEYIGDQKVCFIGEPPAYDEDVMAVMEYDEIYNYLLIYSEKYLEEYPEDKQEIFHLLDVVKKRWGLHY